MSSASGNRACQLFRAAIARIRSKYRASLALSQTHAATQDRLLIEQYLARFANQASLHLSGYDGAAESGVGARTKVISGMTLSPCQIRNAKKVLMKQGPSRSLPDALCFRQLIRILRVAIVNDLSDDQLTFLGTRVEGVHVDIGQTVFQIGDAGDQFFIVLNGCLSVHIHATAAPTPVDNDQPQLIQISVLSSGRGFGERSILDREPRKATVRAMQPSLLVAMGRDTFNWMMQALFNCKLQTKMEFFTRLPLCRRWPRRDVLRLALPFNSVDVRRGAVVTREGDVRTTIDIVVDGQLVVRRHEIPIASIGAGIAIEAYEALNGYRCRNTVVCPLQRSASLFSVSCNDLMAALRSSSSALTSLIEHLQMMRALLDTHYESAASGLKQRMPETPCRPAPNLAPIHVPFPDEARRSASTDSVTMWKNESDQSIVKDYSNVSARNRKAHMRQAAVNSEQFSLPDPFPFSITIGSDNGDAIIL